MKSDFELIARFKSGDSEAFHALARRHHVSLHNFFFMLTGRESAAQELTRAVFEQLIADRYRLPVERKFSTSLYRLGYNRWVAFEQTGGMKRHAAETAEPEDSDQAQQINEQNEALRLLALLPRELKFLLVLSESNRLSFREIAEVLDISEEAVARRVSQAIALLSVSLQKPALAAPAESFPLQLREPDSTDTTATDKSASGSGERPANKSSE
jgi:RNA polymerase sigma-70 factor (ECF subfamily)